MYLQGTILAYLYCSHNRLWAPVSLDSSLKFLLVLSYHSLYLQLEWVRTTNIQLLPQYQLRSILTTVNAIEHQHDKMISMLKQVAVRNSYITVSSSESGNHNAPQTSPQTSRI